MCSYRCRDDFNIPNPQVHDFVQHWALHYEFIGKEGNNPLEFALRPVASSPVHPSYTNSKNRVPDQGKPTAGAPILRRLQFTWHVVENNDQIKFILILLEKLSTDVPSSDITPLEQVVRRLHHNKVVEFMSYRRSIEQVHAAVQEYC